MTVHPSSPRETSVSFSPDVPIGASPKKLSLDLFSNFNETESNVAYVFLSSPASKQMQPDMNSYMQDFWMTNYNLPSSPRSNEPSLESISKELAQTTYESPRLLYIQIPGSPKTNPIGILDECNFLNSPVSEKFQSPTENPVESYSPTSSSSNSLPSYSFSSDEDEVESQSSETLTLNISNMVFGDEDSIEKEEAPELEKRSSPSKLNTNQTIFESSEMTWD